MGVRRSLIIMENEMVLMTVICDMGVSNVAYQFTSRKQAEAFFWRARDNSNVIDVRWHSETTVHKTADDAMCALSAWK